MRRVLWISIFIVALGTERTFAHDIYTHLKSKSGKSCCDNSDCRPAPYRVTSSGVEMLVGETWVWVPRGRVEYRTLEGDTGETNGGHWCGEWYDGGFITYCAFLPPNLASKWSQRQRSGS
jgi:hypothetical protein